MKPKQGPGREHVWKSEQDGKNLAWGEYGGPEELKGYERDYRVAVGRELVSAGIGMVSSSQ